MTHQTAKAIIKRNPYNSIIAYDTIDKIYTDFRLELEEEFKRGQEDVLSRSCEGCKWLMFCGIKKTLDTNHAVAPPEFSCNRWEQR